MRSTCVRQRVWDNNSISNDNNDPPVKPAMLASHKKKKARPGLLTQHGEVDGVLQEARFCGVSVAAAATAAGGRGFAGRRVLGAAGDGRGVVGGRDPQGDATHGGVGAVAGSGVHLLVHFCRGEGGK